MNARDILIVGGYGEVGRRMAAVLESWNPGRVILAGRNPPLTSDFRTRRIDIDQPATIAPALEGVGVVIACVTQSSPNLLRIAARSGVGYTSIAPPWMPWDSLAELRNDATRSGARIVLAAGLEPGISSVLARIGAHLVGPVDEIETALVLGVGDAYGADSMAFLLGEIAQTYAVTIGGREETVHAFEKPSRVVFPDPIGARRVYAMPFRDQLYYPKTLGAKTAISRLALDPPWLSSAIAKLTKVGARSWVKRKGGGAVIHRLTEWLRRHYEGRNQFALVVEVRGREGSIRSSLTGRGQAHATAVGASAIAQVLSAQEIDPGVFLAEQVIAPDMFLKRLAEHGLVPLIGEKRSAESDSGR